MLTMPMLTMPMLTMPMLTMPMCTREDMLVHTGRGTGMPCPCCCACACASPPSPGHVECVSPWEVDISMVLCRAWQEEWREDMLAVTQIRNLVWEPQSANAYQSQQADEGGWARKLWARASSWLWGGGTGTVAQRHGC